MTSNRQKIILLILLGLLLWAAFSAATYLGWIHGADHRDFYPWWAAARLHFFQGLDPYALDTTGKMQLLLYGHTIPPNLDQQAFHYPAQLLVLLFPLWWIPNVEIAAAIWAGFSVVLLFAALAISNQFSDRKRPLGLLAALLLWQYPLLMIFQVQITALPLASLVAAFWAYTRRKDRLAGITLGLALVKPELCLAPWAVLAVIALLQKRWRLLAFFIGTEALLFLLSLAAAGWWLPGWIAAVSRYSSYAKSTWTPLTAWQIHPLVAFTSYALVAWIFYILRKNPTALFAASIPLSMLALPQTPIWNLTMLLLPLSLAWQGKGRWVVALTWVLGWAIFPFPATWQIQYLVFPLLSLLALTLAYGKRSELGFRHLLSRKSRLNPPESASFEKTEVQPGSVS